MYSRVPDMCVTYSYVVSLRAISLGDTCRGHTTSSDPISDTVHCRDTGPCRGTCVVCSKLTQNIAIVDQQVIRFIE